MLEGLVITDRGKDHFRAGPSTHHRKARDLIAGEDLVRATVALPDARCTTPVPVMEVNLPLADELAALTARMADLLLTHDAVGESVHALTQVLVEAIPGTAGAGNSLMDACGHRTSTSATHPVVMDADQLQYTLRQGPCLTAWAQQTTSTTRDRNRDGPRGPGPSPICHCAHPLSTPDGAIGALKIYSPNPHGFDSRAILIADLLARPAALMLANAHARDTTQHLSNGLIRTLRGHDALGTATGILMERFHSSRDQALATLITTSRERHQPQHQLAQDIISGATTA